MKKSIVIMIAAGILLTGCNNQQNTPNTNSDTTKPRVGDIQTGENESKIKAENIEIVLFHGTYRCYSCNKMEELIEKTLDQNFKEEISNGKIIFLSINSELPENIEITKRYGATGLSVFINGIENGKDNIQTESNAWRLINNETKFKEYLSEKIKNL